jgi:hypothetical protein
MEISSRRIKEVIVSVFFAIIIFGIPNVLQAQDCTVNANIAETVCANDTIVLKGNSGGNIDGITTWSQISGPSVLINSPNDLQTTVTGYGGSDVVQVFEFCISAKCQDGVNIRDCVIFTVLPITIATNLGADQTVCPGSPAGVPLEANALGLNEVGIWGGSEAGISVNSPGDPNSTFNASGTSSGNANLTWTISNTNGCSSVSAPVTITNLGGITPVNAGPDIIASSKSIILLENIAI